MYLYHVMKTSIIVPLKFLKLKLFYKMFSYWTIVLIISFKYLNRNQSYTIQTILI